MDPCDFVPIISFKEENNVQIRDYRQWTDKQGVHMVFVLIILVEDLLLRSEKNGCPKSRTKVLKNILRIYVAGTASRSDTSWKLYSSLLSFTMYSLWLVYLIHVY